jgi:hypothetical protein
MSYLKENLDECLFELNETIVFLINLSSDEINHDPELVNEAVKHIKSLSRLNTIIREEDPVV